MKRSIWALVALVFGAVALMLQAPAEAGSKRHHFGKPFHHTDQFDRIDKQKRERERARKRAAKKKAAQRRAAQRRAAKKAAAKKAAARKAAAKKAAARKAAAKKAAARKAASKKAAARKAAQARAVQNKSKAAKKAKAAIAKAAPVGAPKPSVVLPERAEGVAKEAVSKSVGLAVSPKADKAGRTAARIVDKAAGGQKGAAAGATCKRYLPSAGVTIDVPCGE